ncbi:MAG: 30S ribosomal protein S4 [Chloroflexi bacterium]|nr:30S ribosomal protein S4 [Chloroflexota bacterium]
MARYTGPLKKKLKSLGMLAQERARGRGPQERAPRRRQSQYGLQLQEKQKAKLLYGVLERQFSNYYREAARRTGVTGDNLIQLLEGRLDNVVYRLGFASTRRQARQMVNHGHIQINAKKVDIPSYQVRPGQKITWRERSRGSGLFEVITANTGMGKTSQVPSWLRVTPDDAAGEMAALPNPMEGEVIIDTRQIVEYYSRR